MSKIKREPPVRLDGEMDWLIIYAALNKSAWARAESIQKAIGRLGKLAASRGVAPGGKRGK